MGVTYTITIRLKPYLQEFLKSQMETELISSKKNFLGIILAQYIEYTPKDYIPPKYDEDDPFITKVIIPHKIGGKDIRNNTIYISEKNQKAFEKVLTAYFNDIFYNYMRDKVRYTKEIKKCILNFCSDYHLTFDNVSYETLKKSFYRHQKKIKKLNTFKSLNSPLFFLL